MNKERSPSGGFLSKVVSFVRNPTVHWADLDAAEVERESHYSKQMLKEMIERKRRNDFVRRREFDQLRKLRRREPLASEPVDDSSARTSFFQNSMASPDERAVTLKKIDEIEAQMSQQWWKGKAAAVHQEPSAPAVNAFPVHPAALQSQAGADAGQDTSASDHMPTVPPLLVDESAAALAQAPVVQQASAEAPPFVHDPDLEEAAILFAHGEDEAAAAGLLELLAQRRHEEPPRQHELWMTLFDLYRAIGRQEAFDALAIDYAALFGRSAPLWFSMPEQLGLPALAESVAAPAAGQSARELHWSAPSVLSLQSVASLKAALAQAAPPWTLNWTRLTDVEPAAVVALADLVERWAEQEGVLQFFGVPALRAVLQQHTPSGQPGGDPQWWRLRMALLRLMGQVDEFELVALDYCITYEVSPPSWERSRCAFSGDDEVQALDSRPQGLDSELPSQLDSVPAYAPPELSGQITGDATAQLDAMVAPLQPGQPFVVDCSRLVRLDFAAAGSVLNWAALQQGQGYRLRFTRLHRLVAVFFNVIGIHEHARVLPRDN